MDLDTVTTNCARITRHAKQSLLKPNPKLDHALKNSSAQGLPDITVSSLQGQYLAIQCQLINARRVLEMGTLGGYSTIWFASTGAKVTGIEIDEHHRNVALENTKGLDVEILLGSALDILPKLISEGQVFDFILIDADWDDHWECFDFAVKLVRPGGCIYVDNAMRAHLEDWDGKREKEESFLTMVGKDDRVQATFVPMFNSHKENKVENFDGFVQAVVKSKAN